MRKAITDYLNKKKRQILKAASWIDETERAEFFSELADWAYAQYEAMAIDGEYENQNNMSNNPKIK